jgi:pyrroline-5-carboxylate reductase
MSKIGFIGVGELALYTIKGLRRGGYRGEILLSPRNREKSEFLQRQFDCQRLHDNQSVASQSDYVFIATRPAECLETLSALEFRPGQVLVSVVAGIEIDRLRPAVAADIEIVRAMPVSSAEAGASPTLVYPVEDFVCRLFDHCGNAITVDNEDIFTQGSILACVYCWYFSLFETLIHSTRGPKLPSGLSAELVMGMARGAAELALKNRELSPGEIAAGIATDGTFSKLGLDLLNSKSAFDPWREACELLEKQLAGNG